MIGRKKQKYVTGLDIGTTKIVAIIGERADDGSLNILGVGSNPSQGLKRGMVVDIEATVDSIQKAVAKAEEMASLPVKDVYVGIAGSHINSTNSKGTVEISNTARGITEQDRLRVLERARAMVSKADDREIIHVIAQEYLVDGAGGIQNPVGMSGATLDVRVHVVLAAVTSATNIIRCINLAGFQTRDIMLESLASSLAILSDNEKDLGVLLIDIGGGTSDLAAFAHGAVQFSGVIPLGGDSVTNDVAYGLKISRYDAENVKKKYGSVLTEQIPSTELIEVSEVLREGRGTASRRFLSEVVEARLEQIFVRARRMTEESGVRNRIHAGVVLTGGTALMHGITDLAERIFECPAKVGTPTNLRGMSGIVSSPIYSTGIGLVLHGLSNAPPGAANYASNGTLVGKVLHSLKRFIEWYS